MNSEDGRLTFRFLTRRPGAPLAIELSEPRYRPVDKRNAAAAILLPRLEGHSEVLDDSKLRQDH
jgi:hypothetical protein